MVLNCAGETRKRDVTTMFTYSHANTPLGQSERAHYLSYFINTYRAFRAIANIINLQYNVKPISCTLIVIFSEMCMDTTNGLFYVSTIKL